MKGRTGLLVLLGLLLALGLAVFWNWKPSGKPQKDPLPQKTEARLNQNTKNALLGSLRRSGLLKATPTQEALAARAASMDAAQLEKAIQKQSGKRLSQNPWPGTAFLLASRWQKTNDLPAGQLAARILTALARNPGPPPEREFHVWENILSDPALFAFALLDGVGANSPLTPEQRTTVVKGFQLGHTRFREIADTSPELSNLTPFALRPLMAAALACDDEAMAQTVLQTVEQLYSQKYFLSDGTWYEGAPSYMQQTIGNVAPVLKALQTFSQAYPEMKGASSRIAELQKKQAFFQRALDTMQFPDGSPLTQGDSHQGKPRVAPADQRFLSWQLPDYGLFSLAKGQGKTGTAAYLSLPLTARGGRYGGGHQHDDRLALTLWGAGTDALSDAGYPVYAPGNHRYFHMSAWPHNVAVATPADPTVLPNGWNRSALLAYDSGEVSGGEIQLMEGSSPGPIQEGIEKARRLIALISISEGRSYVVDVFRLKGGVVHESFLRPFEDEDATLTCSLPRVATGQDLDQVLKGKPGYLPKFRKLLKQVERIEGTQDALIVWRGLSSGTQIHVWLRAAAGLETLLSRFPRLRPTLNQVKTRDDFPGWHIYRRREARDGKGTLFAAVYEVSASGVAPLVQGVRWLPTPNPESVAFEVALTSGRKDHILVGHPGQPVSFGDLTMEGRFAVLIRDPGHPLRSYLYGAGEITLGDYRHTGIPNFEASVLEVHNTFGTGRAEILLHTTELPKTGIWGTLLHGDGSGSAFKVHRAHLTDDQVRLETSGLGEEILGNNGSRAVFPLGQTLKPPFRVLMEQPTYQKQTESAPNTTIFNPHGDTSG